MTASLCHQSSKQNRTSRSLIALPLKKATSRFKKQHESLMLFSPPIQPPPPATTSTHTRAPSLSPSFLSRLNLITPCSEPVIKAESSPPHPRLLCNSTCIIAAPNLFSVASAGSQPASPIGLQVLIDSHFMPVSDKTKVGFHRASLILLLQLLRR